MRRALFLWTPVPAGRWREPQATGTEFLRRAFPPATAVAWNLLSLQHDETPVGHTDSAAGGGRAAGAGTVRDRAGDPA